MSLALTFAPILTMPDSSRSFSASFRDVRDVAGHLLLAELRVAGLDLELLDVDRVNRSSFTSLSETRIASSKL